MAIIITRTFCLATYYSWYQNQGWGVLHMYGKCATREIVSLRLYQFFCTDPVYNSQHLFLHIQLKGAVDSQKNCCILITNKIHWICYNNPIWHRIQTELKENVILWRWESLPGTFLLAMHKKKEKRKQQRKKSWIKLPFIHVHQCVWYTKSPSDIRKDTVTHVWAVNFKINTAASSLKQTP